MIEITRDDTERIEAALELQFDDEAREVVRCLDSRDVQACPGSGKTTALVAKLLILDRKMPLPDGKGVCVLTHTNVAVDQIRRFAPEAGLLFNDPSFCGTIQSFVDRFLALPAYAEYYGKRPIAIDAEWYERTIRAHFSRLTVADKQHLIPRRGSGWGKLDEAYARANKLRCSLRAGKTIYVEKGVEGAFAVTEGTDRYRVARSLKEATFRSGILHFDDCYFLAKKYLHDHPELTRLFRLRFPYVFIDEMQDSSYQQMELLQHLFGEEVVLQCFGDTNQRIYTDDGSKSEGWQPRAGHLTMSRSRRLATVTASAVRHVCHSPHAELFGHADSAIPPKILLFDEGSVSEVLPAFARLIAAHNLTDARYPFKAVGRRGKPYGDPTHLTIGSYFPAYTLRRTSVGKPSSLAGYLFLSKDKSPKEFWLASLEAAQRTLLLSEGGRESIARQSLSQFARHMEREKPQLYVDFRGESLRWYAEMQAGTDCCAPVREFMKARMLPSFGMDRAELNQEATGFLDGTEILPIPFSMDEPANEYVFEDGATSPAIRIHLDTVHAVKGETHTATLLLETFYRGHDVADILDELITPGALRGRREAWNKLPLAYVAMTRPRDMLCVALGMGQGADRVQITEVQMRGLERAGWEIVHVRLPEISPAADTDPLKTVPVPTLFTFQS